ncbi:MAG: glycosyltransferase [Planctomycetota bacterium]
MPTDDAAQPPLVPEAPPRRVGLIIAIHRNVDDIGPCLASVFADADAHSQIGLTVVVVDDASVDAGPDLVADRFPRADLLRLPDNLGFAGANNAGYDRLTALVPNLEYVALLNADTVVRPGWLAALLAFLDAHPDAGAAQPKILLHDEPHLINTVGNRLHYLGFGMMTAYREPDDGRFDTPREIGFPSGCAVLLRAGWLAEHGLFDPAFGMYLEDADLGLRLHATGHPPWYCSAAAVLHRYTPDAPTKAYRQLERNRYLILLTYWRWRLLVAVSPMLLLMDAMQWVYVITIGQPLSRLRNLAWLLGPGRAVARRRRTQNLRVDPIQLVSRIDLPAGEPWLLRRLVNPGLEAYSRLAGLGREGVDGVAAFSGKAVASVTCRGGAMLLSLAAFLVASAVLGPDGFGRFSIALAWAMILAIGCSMGAGRLVIREVASGRPGFRQRALTVTLTMAAAVCISACLAATLGWRIADSLWLTLATAGFVPLMTLGLVTRSMLEGLGRPLMGFVPLAMLPAVAMLATACLVPPTGAPSTWALIMLLASMAGHAIAGAVLWWSGRETERPLTDREPGRLTWSTYIVMAAPFAAADLMMIVSARADLLLIGWMLDTEQAGIYALSSRAAELVGLPLQAVNAVVGAAVVRFAAKRQRADMETTLRRSARLAGATSSAMLLGLILCGRFGLSLAGEVYAQGYPTMIVLASAQVVSACVGSVGMALSLLGHERRVLATFAGSTLLNIGLNLALIPSLGLTGAAMATAISLLAWNLMLWHACWRKIGCNPAAIGPRSAAS